VTTITQTGASLLKEGKSKVRVSGGLQPLQAPLSRIQAAHFLRRTSFYGTAADVALLAGRQAVDVVNEAVDAAMSLEMPPAPEWVLDYPPGRDALASERQAYNTQNGVWLRDYRRAWYLELKNSGFRECLTLFWHNHFVTETQPYRYAVLAYRYLYLLRKNAFGDFKSFVRAAGIDQAMLIYLDGNSNTRVAPNENYARELLELFTMGPLDKNGQPNYTENDVQEIAAALAGWVIDWENRRSVFDPSRHFDEEKTIFGVTGDFGYDDVIDLIFSERAEQTAYFLAKKLYQAYIYETPDPEFLQALADEIIANNFVIHPVLRSLLASEHFFDPVNIGAMIKSPLDILIGMGRMFSIENSSNLPRYYDNASTLLGQRLLNPPNVAGWPGYHGWLSTTSMPLRWIAGDIAIFGGGGSLEPNLIPLAASLHDPNDPAAAFYLPTAMAEFLLALPLTDVEIPEITDEFGGDLVNNPLPDDIMNGPAYVRNLAKAFLAGLPWYEWYLYNNGAHNHLQAFVRNLLTYPEFQLL